MDFQRRVKKKSSRFLLIMLVVAGMIGLVSSEKNSINAAVGSYDAPSYGQISAVKYVKVANGHMGGAGLDSSGGVWSWGYNLYGDTGVREFGNGKPLTTTADPSGYLGGMRRIEYFAENNIKIVELEASYQSRWALSADGDVYAWGHGASGIMGDGNTTSVNMTPKKVPGLPKIAHVYPNDAYLGDASIFALDVDGNTWSWGSNVYGELGRSDITTAQSRVPGKVSLPNGTQFKDIYGGWQFTVAVDTEGNIWTAGNKANGMQGDGTTGGSKNESFVKMTKPAGMGKITAVSASYHRALALDENGKVWEWGETYGYAGAGVPVNISTPKAITMSSAAIASAGYTPVPTKIIAGESVCYFIDQYGRSWAWGDNRYIAFGNDGGQTTNRTTRITEAIQMPFAVGDGDTQWNTKDEKLPRYLDETNGIYPDTYGGYGINSLHPTIYDEKYMQMDDEGYVLDSEGTRLILQTADSATYKRGLYYKLDASNNKTTEKALPAVDEKEALWINLAGKDVPYIAEMYASRGAYTILDKDGNIYRWSETGSGVIAWGWDVESEKTGPYDRAYDQNPTTNEHRGLYDRYVYEVMYMRGAPMVDPIVLNLEKNTEKIYSTEGNTAKETVTVDVKLPAAFDSKEMNITINSELQDVKYVFVPYDKNNADFNISTEDMTVEKFNELYTDSYAKGDLLDSPIDGGQNGTTWTKGIDITANGRIYVMTTDNAYGKVSNTFTAYTSDSFYTPVTVQHKGVGEKHPTLETDDTLLYSETSDNVSKTNNDGVSTTVFGLPLDVNGNVIENPTFGYDKVSISRLNPLPNGEEKYWTLVSTSPQNITLDNISYKDGYVYTFRFIRNMDNWSIVNYRGEDIENKGQDLAGFSMPGGNSEIIKKDVELTKNPQQVIGEYTIIGYYTSEDDIVKLLSNDGSLTYTPQTLFSPEKEGTITFVYGKPNIEVTKSVSDSNSDTKASPGEVLHYSIVVKNTGTAGSKGTIVKDTLSDVIGKVVEDGTSNVTVTSIGGTNSGTITLQDLINGKAYDVAKDEEITVSFALTVKSDLDTEAVKQIANKVTAGDDEDEVIINTGAEKFEVVKEVTDENNDGRASGGEKLTYKVTATNAGNATASGAIVKDDLAAIKEYLNISGVSVTVTSSVDSNKNGTITLAELMSGKAYDVVAGEKITLTFEVEVKENHGLTDGTMLENTVFVGRTGKDDEKIPVGEANFSLDKNVVDQNNDNMASPGEELIYTITAKNIGSATSMQTVIKDAMTTVAPNIKEDPTSVVVTVVSTGTNSGTITLSELMSGKAYDFGINEEMNLTFKVTVKDDCKAEEIANKATIGDKEKIVIIETAEPEVGGTKVVSDANNDGIASASEALTYTITVSNNGNIAAKGVGVKDSLVTVLPYIKNKNVGINISSNVDSSKNTTDKVLNDLITGLQYDLAVSEVVTITFTVNVIDDTTSLPEEIINKVVINDNEIEEKIPTGEPTWLVDKEAVDANGDGKVSASEEVTYTIDVENTSDVTASQALIKDDLATLKSYIKETNYGLVVVNVTSTNATNVMQISLADLMSGKAFDILGHEKLVLTFKVTVIDSLDTAVVSQLANKVTVGEDGEDEEIIETGKPNWQVDKAVVDENKDGKAQPSEELTYTITATNDSDVIANNVVVKDTMSDVLGHIVNGANPENINVTISSVKDPSKDTTVSLDKLIAGINFKKVDANETIIITFKVKVKADLDVETVTELTNVVLVGKDGKDEEEIETGQSSFEVNKEASDASLDGKAAPGEEITYTITAKNTGDAKADGAVIKDALTNFEQYVNSLAGNVSVVSSVDGDLASITIAQLRAGVAYDIEVGETITLSFKVTIKADLDVASVTSISNKAVVSPKDSDPVEKEEDIETGAPGVGGTKVVVDANGDGKAAPKEKLSYTITATNSGTTLAKDVVIKDDMAQIKAYIDNGDALENIAITINSNKDAGKNRLGNLAELVSGLQYDVVAEEVITITFDVYVKADLKVEETSMLVNTLKIDEEEIEEEIPTGKAKWIVDKKVEDANNDGKASSNETLKYTITAKNIGDAVASDVKVQDDLKDVKAYLKSTNVNVSIKSSKGTTTTISLADLMAGKTFTIDIQEELTLEFSVEVIDNLDTDAVKELANKVTVGDDGEDEEIIETGDPKITGAKHVTDTNLDGKASPSEDLTYELIVMNSGSATANDVGLKDTMVDILPYIKNTNVAVSITYTNDTTKNRTTTLSEIITGLEFDVPANETITVKFVVEVIDDLDVDVVRELKNVATINDEDVPEIIETGEVDFSASKAVSDTNGDKIASPNEKLTYVITAKNSGTAVYNDMVIKDSLTNVLPHIINGASPGNINVTINSTQDTAKNEVITLDELIAGLKYDLGANETITVTFDVVVKADLDVTAIPVIANKATVGDDEPGIDIPTGEPGVGGTKTVTDANGDGVASPAEELTYMITATNAGSAQANDVIVKDALVDVLPYITNPNATITIDSNKDDAKDSTIKTLNDLVAGFKWNVQANEVITITFKVTINANIDLEAVEAIKNIAIVGETEPEIEIPTGEVGIGSSKEVKDTNGDEIASPSEELTYTIKATNNGKATADSVQFKDTLADVLPYIKNGNNPDSIAVVITSNKDITKNATVDLGDLIAGFNYKMVAGEEIVITFKVTVASDIDLDEVKVLKNIAVVGDGEPEIEIPTGETNIVGDKKVVDASGDKVASPNENLAYTITAENTGNATANNVSIKDDMVDMKAYIVDGNNPENINVTVVSNVDSTKNATITLQDLMDGLSYNLIKNEKITITFTVTVISNIDLDSVVKLSNVAVVGDKSPGEEIPTGETDFNSKKEVSDTNGDKVASPGESLSYKITAENKGKATGTIQIKDSLTGILPHITNGNNPENIAVEITSNKDASKNITSSLDKLIAGYNLILEEDEIVTIVFNVVVKADLDVDVVSALTNIAVVGDDNPTITIPTGEADVSIEKEVTDTNGDGKASPKEVLTYVITAKNDGSAQADNIVIKDALTQLLPYIKNGTNPSQISISIDSSNDAHDMTTTLDRLVAGIVYQLQAGEEISFEFEVEVAEDIDLETVTELKNIATAGDEEAIVIIETGEPAVGGTKVVSDTNDDGVASPGEELTYKIDVVNAGDATANDVSIKDTMIDVLPYIENGSNPSAIDVVIDGSNSANDATVTLVQLIAGLKYDLKSGETISITFKVVVNSTLDVDTVTEITNVVLVNDDKVIEVIETGEPNVDGKKEVTEASGDKFASPNETLTYTITATNSGDATANDVAIKDTLATVLPYIKNGINPSSINVVVTSTTDTTKNETITLDRLIAGLEYDLQANETVVLTFKVTVLEDLDVLDVKSISNTATIGDEDETVTIITGETKVISGRVFEDVNYDHTMNDNAYFANHKVYLVDSGTDSTLATTTTDGNGFYQFEIQMGGKTKAVQGSGSYHIMVDAKAGHMVADKSVSTPQISSIVDVDSLKSDVIDLNAADLTNHHIGLAKDIVVTVVPDEHFIKVGDKVISNINLDYGKLINVKVNNKNVEFTVENGVLNITGLEVGTSQIALEFEDNYSRKVVTKVVDVTISEKSQDIVVDENEKEEPETEQNITLPRTGTVDLSIALVILILASVTVFGKGFYQRRNNA